MRHHVTCLLHVGNFSWLGKRRRLLGLLASRPRAGVAEPKLLEISMKTIRAELRLLHHFQNTNVLVSRFAHDRCYFSFIRTFT